MELPEGKLFTVGDALGRVNRASLHIDQTLGNLKKCRVNIDEDSFRNVQFYLDKINQNLSKVVTEHIDAQAAA